MNVDFDVREELIKGFDDRQIATAAEHIWIEEGDLIDDIGVVALAWIEIAFFKFVGGSKNFFGAFEKIFAIRRWGDAFGATFKNGNALMVFYFFDDAGQVLLAHIQFFCSFADRTAFIRTKDIGKIIEIHSLISLVLIIAQDTVDAKEDT